MNRSENTFQTIESLPWSQCRPRGWTCGRVELGPSSFPAARASFPHSCGVRLRKVCTQMGDDWPWPPVWIWGNQVQSNHKVRLLKCRMITYYCNTGQFIPTFQGWTCQDQASVLGHDGGNRLESQTLLLLGMTVRSPHSHVQFLSQTCVE